MCVQACSGVLFHPFSPLVASLCRVIDFGREDSALLTRLCVCARLMEMSATHVVRIRAA